MSINFAISKILSSKLFGIYVSESSRHIDSPTNSSLANCSISGWVCVDSTITMYFDLASLLSLDFFFDFSFFERDRQSAHTASLGIIILNGMLIVGIVTGLLRLPLGGM